MNMEIEEFKNIIRELKRIKYEERLNNLDDDILFDGAVRIYNSLNINRPKIERKKEIALMTEKQRKLLQDLNYKGTLNLTKSEATKVIQEFLESQKMRGTAK